MEARWLKKKDKLIRDILLLSHRISLIDFVDRFPVNRKKIKISEHHHLYPIDFLKKEWFRR